jgi:hypothetical protein
MVLTLATVTIGLAAVTLCTTIGVVALLARVLNAIDLAGLAGGDSGGDGGSGRPREPDPPVGGGEPDWWDDFEAQLAEHVASRSALPQGQAKSARGGGVVGRSPTLPRTARAVGEMRQLTDDRRTGLGQRSSP